MHNKQRPAKTPQQRPSSVPNSVPDSEHAEAEPVGLSEIGKENAADAGSDKIAIPLPIEENDSNAQTT